MKRFVRTIAVGFGVMLAGQQVEARPGYYWQNANRHSFCDNLPAGREADGKPLFVSQISRQGIRIGVNITLNEQGDPVGGGGSIGSQHDSWHIGKAGVHLKDGMTYSYGGKEYDVGSIHIPQGNKYKHLVLCRDEKGLANPHFFKWVALSGGASHPNAIKGFNDKEGQIVCRANWGGGVHPGKLIPSSNACFIGYGGGEKAVQSYEVLIYQE